MAGRMILHAGPPIEWERMCGPMQGAIIGAILYEGWAKIPTARGRWLPSGEIAFEPCHHHAAVGPMAGVISPSMPVWIVRDATHGNRAFSNLNEGLGKVLRFGANGPEVHRPAASGWRRGLRTDAAGRRCEMLGRLDLKPLMAQALHMGDEVHNRNVAAIVAAS